MHFRSYASREVKYNGRDMVGNFFSLCKSGNMLVHDMQIDRFDCTSNLISDLLVKVDLLSYSIQERNY